MVAVVRQDPAGKVVACSSFDVEDLAVSILKTTLSQLFKICLFVTRTTVHPSERKSESFLASRDFCFDDVCEWPSTSIAIISSSIATSIAQVELPDRIVFSKVPPK